MPIGCLVPLAIAFVVVAVILIITNVVNSANNAPATSSGECATSMETAAAVEALDNDAELLATLTACETVDEWVAALQANPGAGSFESYTVAEAEELLSMTCARAPEAVVCVDGAASGRI